MLEAREDMLAFRHFPHQRWRGLEHQPARARQRGNKAHHHAGITRLVDAVLLEKD